MGKGHAMTTLENTISMMKTLSETDLVEIQRLTKKLFQRHERELVDKKMGKFLRPTSPAPLAVRPAHGPREQGADP